MYGYLRFFYIILPKGKMGVYRTVFETPSQTRHHDDHIKYYCRHSFHHFKVINHSFDVLNLFEYRQLNFLAVMYSVS